MCMVDQGSDSKASCTRQRRNFACCRSLDLQLAHILLCLIDINILASYYCFSTDGCNLSHVPINVNALAGVRKENCVESILS